MICHFNKAQFLKGEEVLLQAEAGECLTGIEIYMLEEQIFPEICFEGSSVRIRGLETGGYGIKTFGKDEKWEGAFDVVASKREIVRYGFLSDFPAEEKECRDVEWMRDLHLNCIQFYDWMYKHDRLISPDEEYKDPMGRATSLNTLRRKIKSCSENGIRPFAYGAVYAATEDTYKEHPEWAMYTKEGSPIRFADWLYYMNVSKDCGWTGHLLKQYGEAIKFGFKGIHMDTYGFPKWVWDSSGRKINLQECFAVLVDTAEDAVKSLDPEAGVIFNAVNNWPTEKVVDTSEDAVYVEVWPPNDNYRDLYTIIRDIKASTDKSVILAAYMKPFAKNNADESEYALRLAWAVISASGGTQLVFGEDRSVLCDSYYANYAGLRTRFLPIAQKYCDYLVRYSSLLYADKGIDISRTASGGINEDICFAAENAEFSVDGKADSVWTIIRETDELINIQLINLCGNDSLWNSTKKPPRKVHDIRITLRLDRELNGAWYATPDTGSLQAQSIATEVVDTSMGRVYTLTIPELYCWTSVWVNIK